MILKITQDWIAYAIVAIATWMVFRKFYRTVLAESVAIWLLRHGQVKWAMRLRPKKKDSSCNSCH